MKRTRHERKAFGRFLANNFGGVFRMVRSADGPEAIGNWLGRILSAEKPAAVKPFVLPLKHLRLSELAEAGFNCPDFRYWLRGKLNVSELRAFYETHGRLSLRNFTEERLGEPTPKLPVLYDQGDWSAVEAFCAKHNREHHTLVNEALPLRDSLIAGNIVLLDSERYIISYFFGHGTPRDVDERSVARLEVLVGEFGTEAGLPPGLAGIPERLRSFRLGFRPMTFEFSYYDRLVGVLAVPEIFWEWRCGSADSVVLAALLKATTPRRMTLQFSEW